MQLQKIKFIYLLPIFIFLKVYIFNLILKYDLLVVRSTKLKNALTTMNAALDQYEWRKTLEGLFSHQSKTYWEEKKLEDKRNELIGYIHQGKIIYPTLNLIK
jgi:hypothetical protein